MSLKEQLGDVVLVIAGADSLVGESLLEQLAEAGVAAEQVIPLLSGDEGGARLEYGATRLKSRPAQRHQFTAGQFFLVPPNLVSLDATLPGRAQSEGATVLSWSTDPSHSQSEDEPLLAWDRASRATVDQSAFRVVSPVAAQILRVVARLETLGTVEKVSCHAQLAVSEKGRAGVSELAAQTARILNVQDFDTAHFAKQIAFNVIPDDLGSQVEQELQALLPGEPEVQVSAAYVPVFFGHSVHIRLEMSEAVALAAVQGALEGDPLVDILDPQEGVLTPVGEAANQDQILIGDLTVKSGSKSNNVVSLWSCADNVRVGTALSGIQAVGFLVQKRTN